MPMTSIDKQIVKLAIPAIVTNITVPILGMTDLAIAGHLGNAAYIGAVSIGTMTFNMIYWIFGFLRMGTSGLTAQAYGAHDYPYTRRLLRQSMAVALFISLIVLFCQRLILHATIGIMQPDTNVANAVDTYFSICVWGAPAVMALYSLTGWFIGMQNTKIPMYVSIVQNIVNLTISLSLVIGLGFHIVGIALGTVTAQWAGLGMALLWFKKLKPSHTKNPKNTIDNRKWHNRLMRFFTVNRDIFLRTLFLVVVNLFFTSFGSHQGTLTLSANTLLFTLFTITSFLLDGLAYAAEALGGKYFGAADRLTFNLLTRRLFVIGSIVSIIFTIIFAIGGDSLLHLLTSEPEVISTALPYLPWAVTIPIAGVTAFLLDGLFIGITATRAMLWSTAVASAIFFVIYLAFSPLLHNHALWLALTAYLFIRGIVSLCFLLFSSSIFKSLNETKN